jgi:general secretion pathway protein D
MKYIYLLVLISFNSFSLDYELNLVNKDLSQFIAWFSDTTNKTIIVDKDIDGKVKVFARQGVDSKDIYSLFVNVLNSQGLSYRIENNVYRVFKTQLNLMPEVIETKFYDFKNISGDFVTSNVIVIESLIDKLIRSHYVQKKSNSVKKDNTNFSVSSLFSGRSLLITAPSFVHEHLGPIVKRLDSQTPQVLVQVIIIETTDIDLFDVGVRWLGKSNKSYLGNNHAPTLDNALALLIENVGFDAAISIIDKTDNVTIKSQPKLSILHAQKGQINVGQNVPFISGSTTSSGANAGNPYTTIQRQDIGLILDVQPFISDNNVTLIINQELSSISEDIQASDIVTDKRSLSTTLSIKAGDTVVLGGLVSEQITKSVSGIPLLMDLPFIGDAFKNSQDKTVIKNLSIAIKVTAI